MLEVVAVYETRAHVNCAANQIAPKTWVTARTEVDKRGQRPKTGKSIVIIMSISQGSSGGSLMAGYSPIRVCNIDSVDIVPTHTSTLQSHRAPQADSASVAISN